MTDINKGLSSEEVKRLAAEGKINGDTNIPTKSIGQIIKSNTLTFFNMINLILAAMVAFVGSFKNMLFIGVIICNTAIGIFQEIRAKRVIDRLSLISAPKVCVIRDGVEKQIAVEEIALGDIMKLTAGGQICADCVIREGSCEVNESLITGESDPVLKNIGDNAMSGSFVVCGEVKAEVIHVGAENFASKITSGAKYIKKNNSEMLASINRIIKVISFCIIPIMLILFCKSMWIDCQTFESAVVTTVAAVIGMIPEGLILLASVVLAVSVIRLSGHNTLVQELYCIETLARVDVLCLDKTGTITEGTMQVQNITPLTDDNCDEPLTALMNALNDGNPTFNAVKEKWNGESRWKCTKALPFSSAKKWSGAEFEGKGSYILGAAEFILGEAFVKVSDTVQKLSEGGQRVLLLAHSENSFRDRDLPEDIVPLAFISISDKIRAEAPDTLKFFAEQGVDIKIISGDNPVTVANIAKKAGLKNADRYVDASTITDIEKACDEYSVFGRVTPDQKLALVKALKAKGHTVGMTGDGVNDVLALKEADCSIAMQSGSDAARNVSNLVLLDSNFASMPLIVAEGRRSINNIERSATLFLTKTVFSFILAIVFSFVTMPYPFVPIQLTLVNAVAIGIPSFLLALEPNFNIIRGKFISNVMKKALPNGLAVVFAMIATSIVSSVLGFTAEQASAVATVIIGIVSLGILVKICIPLDVKRVGLCAALTMIFALGLIIFDDLFCMVTLTPLMAMVSGIISAGGIALVFILPFVTTPIFERVMNHKWKKS
ncbi:MAG: cation-translocating P-type ATPase [Ruminiclostridium sp.]